MEDGKMEVPRKSCCLFPHREKTRIHHGLRAFLAVDGKPLKVYQHEEWGSTVMGSVQAEPGQQFEVCIYDGRSSVRYGYDLNVLFGEQSVACIYMKSDYMGDMVDESADDQTRFTCFGGVRVDSRHIRPFRFEKVPTTDEEAEASKDMNLNMISTIRVQYRRIKQAPRRQKTAEEKRKRKEKRKEEREKKKVEERGSEPDAPEDATPKEMLFESSDKAQFAMTAALGDLVASAAPKRKKKQTKAAPAGAQDEPAPTPANTSATAQSFEDRYNVKKVAYEYVFVDDNHVDLTFEFKIRSSVYIDKLVKNNDHAQERPAMPHVLEQDGELTILDSDDEAEIAQLKKANFDKEMEEEYGDYWLSEDDEEEDDDDDEGADWYAPASGRASRQIASPAPEGDATPRRMTRASQAAARAVAAATGGEGAKDDNVARSPGSSAPSSLPQPTNASLASTRLSNSPSTAPPPSTAEKLPGPNAPPSASPAQSAFTAAFSSHPVPPPSAASSGALPVSKVTSSSHSTPPVTCRPTYEQPVPAASTASTAGKDPSPSSAGETEQTTQAGKASEMDRERETVSDDEAGAEQVAQLLRPEKEQAGAAAEKTADPLPSTSIRTSSDVQPPPPPSYIAAQPAPPPSIPAEILPSPSSALPGAIPASGSVTPQSSLSSVPSPGPAEADSAQSVAPAPPLTAQAGASFAVPFPAGQSPTALQPSTAPAQQVTPAQPTPPSPPGTAAASPIASTPSPVKADLDPPLPSQRDLPDRDELRRKRKAEEELDEKPNLQRIKLEEGEEKKVDLQRIKKEEEEKKVAAAVARAKEKEKDAQYDWSQGI